MTYNPLIVSNGSATVRHSVTGRELNLWPDAKQRDLRVLKFNRRALMAGEVAHTIRDLYKLAHKKSRQNTLDRVNVLIHRLAYDPEILIQLAGLPDKDLSAYRRIAEKLEDMGYIKIFQGFASESGSRPMAIKATDKLIELMKE